MGLSNYVPSSRISQAGVCTSTTRPASPFEGQVVFETDTNRVLVFDASAWVMIADTDQPPGLQLIKSGSLSLTTSATNVTDVFSSDYNQYRLLLNITARSTTNRVDMKYIVGTTATSSGYYQGGIGGDPTSNTTIYMQRSNNDPQLYGENHSARETRVLDIFNPNINYQTMHTGFIHVQGGAVGYAVGGQNSGSDLFTGFQLFTSTGTATAEYQVFGYRNS